LAFISLTGLDDRELKFSIIIGFLLFMTTLLDLLRSTI
jgi:hypothetical protein